MTVTPDYKFVDSQIVEALDASRGNLTLAASFLTAKWGEPCTRAYLKRASEQRPAIIAHLEGIRNAYIDKAEDNIFQAVDNGDYQASVLVVRTLGKERGWVPKEEVDAKMSGEAVLAAIERGRARVKGDPHSGDSASSEKEDA